MNRFLCAAITLQFVAMDCALSQHATPKFRGDTAGAPPGCSAAAGIAAISEWFAAFESADSARLNRVTASKHRGFVFSTGRFASTDTFVDPRSFPALLAYARARQRHHERMTIQQVAFNGWRDRGLEFGPIYLMRSADDLGRAPLPGIGKGEYWCGEGIAVMGLAPRPAIDPGPRP
jgi:hypothetical protein